MPCDTISTVQVQSELKNVNLKLLGMALTAMGFTVNVKEGNLTFYGIHKKTGKTHSGIYQNGKLTEQQRAYYPTLDINDVKKAYSTEVVKNMANSFGWKLTKTGESSYLAQKQ